MNTFIVFFVTLMWASVTAAKPKGFWLSVVALVPRSSGTRSDGRMTFGHSICQMWCIWIPSWNRHHRQQNF